MRPNSIPERRTIGQVVAITITGAVVIPGFAFGLWTWLFWYSRQVTYGNGTSIVMPDIASMCLPLVVWPLASVSMAAFVRRRAASIPGNADAGWPFLILLILAIGFYVLIPLWSMNVFRLRSFAWFFEGGLVVSQWAMLYAAVCLLACARLPQALDWIRSIIILSSLAVAVTFSALHLYGNGWVPNRTWINESFAWLSGISIVIGCCAAGVGLLHQFAIRRAFRSIHGDFPGFRLESACPRCARIRKWSIGRSACESCDLVLFIDLEEETCVGCGYCLTGLPTDQCPECGTARSIIDCSS